jgi:hypothetical protein
MDEIFERIINKKNLQKKKNNKKIRLKSNRKKPNEDEIH